MAGKPKNPELRARLARLIRLNMAAGVSNAEAVRQAKLAVGLVPRGQATPIPAHRGASRRGESTLGVPRWQVKK